MTPEKHPETTMKRHRLTEAEERRLAEAIAAEARAMGLTKKDKMPQETKRRLRARILKAILDRVGSLAAAACHGLKLPL
ncbi:hypothetical protein AM651_005008 [Escherichia coli]|nr:hypothetical protein [Escherichia coli]EFL4419475.1 hypothetical protein [Escherichia coli]EFL8793362.1 hypothetical protein [Escherichia coli]EGZ2950649.1 hypothetical protein [Escherichia coli]EJV3023745.1 hypothetical protein [Escherichia coli]